MWMVCYDDVRGSDPESPFSGSAQAQFWRDVLGGRPYHECPTGNRSNLRSSHSLRQAIDVILEQFENEEEVIEQLIVKPFETGGH